MAYTRIIVPLDGSQLAECALPLAAAFVARSHGEILLVRVAEGSGADLSTSRFTAEAGPSTGSSRGGVLTAPAPVADGGYLEDRPEHSLAEVRRYLGTVADGLVAAGARVAVETANGEPSDAILQVADRQKADLIVMATHGRSGLARSVLGSVTDRVALRSIVPVVVVRSGPGTTVLTPAEQAVRWVLVPLDRSELSESALPHACAIASLFGAQLKLLTVVPSWAGTSQADNAAEYLNGVSSRLDVPAERLSTGVVVGDAEFEIAAQLSLLRDAMAVMTTRGASGLKRWIRGSITDAVIRAGLGPTMVVPPAGPLLGPAIH
jgi:nucleotide-binding universal stress UspA family protein